MIEASPASRSDVSPRPYRLGGRQSAVDETRRRVVAALYDLLDQDDGYRPVTVDAVARRADVARATVYYQFGSKTGLIEALCDWLSERGRMSELRTVFAERDPDVSLERLITIFGHFFATDRLVLRRLRALAVLDTEVGAVMTARDERRRRGVTTLVDRFAERRRTEERTETPMDRAAAVRLLLMVTSFETYDALAGTDQSPADVVDSVLRLAYAALDEAPFLDRPPV
jgi:AcrR family transcriptional regulator